MDAMYFLVPLALGLLAIAIAGFIWAVRRDQFDSLDSAALSIFDDESPKPAGETGDAKKTDV
ncbi:MAG: cbb3-type cytochrome oxidase assembly protein CcoS [Gammaproteobacteria bacterium]|nr:cbb3-type cytochrome oxidase assembly protein CcoS [Gammaproteobacteria bacterium]